MNRAARLALSLLVWWLAAGVALWLLGLAFGRPAPFLGCALSGLFLGAVGELGDWVRRRVRRGRASAATTRPRRRTAA
ncbi:hypothetical protein [Streptomyces sp. NPDC059575]|uniref:hypothetical protein n=1 Tax=Streptomyces sp. NPDC059575 TaxID=3346872 RepID=UPI00368D9EAC